ncbi:hypothetical protein DMA11_23050 [Marinilabiliaceae bacterium JC017]|nr:hypothetical protein DMA11_23050 [Marinilabiliaceae bacterium JC017]
MKVGDGLFIKFINVFYLVGMEEFTTDQKEYLKLVLKNQKKSHSLVAIILLLLSILTAVDYFHTYGLFVSSFSPAIVKLFTVGVLFSLGTYILIQSLKLSVSLKMEELQGVYTCRMRRRKQYEYIGDVSVISPVVWMDYFKRNEHYAVNGVMIKNVFGYKEFLVLKVQGMSDEEANCSLVDSFEAGKYALSKLKSVGLVFSLMVLVSLVGIYYVFRTPELLQKIGEFLLSTGKNELKIYGIITLFVIVSLFVIASKIITHLQVEKIQLDHNISWKEWLVAYQKFMEEEMCVVMNKKRQNTEAFMKLKSTIAKHKRFKLEYRKIKKALHGYEKEEFNRRFKTICHNVKNHQ